MTLDKFIKEELYDQFVHKNFRNHNGSVYVELLNKYFSIKGVEDSLRMNGLTVSGEFIIILSTTSLEEIQKQIIFYITPLSRGIFIEEITFEEDYSEEELGL